MPVGGAGQVKGLASGCALTFKGGILADDNGDSVLLIAKVLQPTLAPSRELGLELSNNGRSGLRFTSLLDELHELSELGLQVVMLRIHRLVKSGEIASNDGEEAQVFVARVLKPALKVRIKFSNKRGKSMRLLGSDGFEETKDVRGGIAEGFMGELHERCWTPLIARSPQTELANLM